ncbi:MAG: uroporphyrinogen-III synthase, partial [Planctomycetota bacterium]
REKDILMPRADIASPDLAERLRALGACVTDVVAYRTLPAEFDADGLFARLRAGEIDAVTLASASTARSLAAGLGWKRVKDIADKTIFAAIGPVTARAAREAGIPVTIEAAEHTLPGLAQALVEHFGSEKKETK